MQCSAGRYVYGLAVVGCGICALVWRDFFALGAVPHHGLLTYLLAIMEIVGGLAILWPRTTRAGAVAVGATYLIFALLGGVPLILQHPLVYAGYGNIFYPLSLAAGAVILYARADRTASSGGRLTQIGYYGFGISVVSFTLEHVFYFHETAILVPKWLPPGQIFWAIATTIGFGLAAIALLTGYLARLAAQLTTVMILGFLLLTWLPTLLADVHNFWSWSESLETLAIAGSAWIVADLLSERGLAGPAHQSAHQSGRVQPIAS
jgi:uncharacterized membrane protein YphA (DoxX/SURF4 family)